MGNKTYQIITYDLTCIQTTYRTYCFVSVLHKVLLLHTVRSWISKMANIEKEKLRETSIKLCRLENIKKFFYVNGMPL